MTRSVRTLFSSTPAALTAPAWVTGPTSSNSLITLCVEHRLSSPGIDGIQHGIRFAEHVHRQDDRAWITRELPSALAHVGYDHANPHTGHKHVDTDAAPRWIERNARGVLTMRAVNASQQKDYAVEPAGHPSIGFDGSWATTYHLLDPAALKGIHAKGPVCNDVQTHHSTQGEHTVTVDQDIAGQHSRRMESRNATGTRRKLTCVTVLLAPAAAPWKRAQRYAAADYIDLIG